jgi:hypothetical protein
MILSSMDIRRSVLPAADMASITAVDAAGADSSSSPGFIHIELISNSFLQLIKLRISNLDIFNGAFLCRLGLALEIAKGRSIGKSAARPHQSKVTAPK